MSLSVLGNLNSKVLYFGVGDRVVEFLERIERRKGRPGTQTRCGQKSNAVQFEQVSGPFTFSFYYLMIDFSSEFIDQIRIRV